MATGKEEITREELLKRLQFSLEQLLYCAERNESETKLQHENRQGFGLGISRGLRLAHQMVHEDVLGNQWKDFKSERSLKNEPANP